MNCRLSARSVRARGIAAFRLDGDHECPSDGVRTEFGRSLRNGWCQPSTPTRTVPQTRVCGHSGQQAPEGAAAAATAQTRPLKSRAAALGARSAARESFARIAACWALVASAAELRKAPTRAARNADARKRERNAKEQRVREKREPQRLPRKAGCGEEFDAIREWVIDEAGPDPT